MIILPSPDLPGASIALGWYAAIAAELERSRIHPDAALGVGLALAVRACEMLGMSTADTRAALNEACDQLAHARGEAAPPDHERCIFHRLSADATRCEACGAPAPHWVGR